MLQREFPGAEDLIRSVDAAVRSGSTAQVTDALRSTLCRLIRDQAVRLPDCCFEACPDHYARRELYQNEDLGYSAIAMTWGPRQGTLPGATGGNSHATYRDKPPSSPCPVTGTLHGCLLKNRGGAHLASR